MKKLLISLTVALATIGAFAAPKSTTMTVATAAGANTASNLTLYVRGEVKEIAAWNDNGATGTVAVVNGSAGLTLESLMTASITTAATASYSRMRQVGTTAAGVALTAATGTAVGTNTTTMLTVPYEAPYVVSAYATITQSSGPADVWHVLIVYDDKSGI